MKKYNFILILAVLLIAGCQKGYNATQEYIITADTPTPTKTNLDNISVKWSNNDAIKVWGKNAYSAEYVYTIKSGQGTSSATFSASSGTNESDIIAIYPAASAEYHTEIYKKAMCPTSTTQSYVENGIQDNLMTMAAVGSPTSLQFKAMGCVLRLRVRSTNNKTLDHITVSSASPISHRLFWDTRSWSTNPNGYYDASSSTITYNVNSILDNSEKEFNIVTCCGTLSKLIFILYASDGTVAVLEKRSDLSTEAGHIYSFPSSVVTFSTPQIEVSYDRGNTWMSWPSDGILEIPTSSISVKTGEGVVLEEADIISVKDAINKASVAIDVDLSMARYGSYNFPATFRSCGKLKNLKLPSNITSFDNNALLYSTLDSLFIGTSITNVPTLLANGSHNAKFVVDASNNNYSSDANGVLYNKNKTILYFASDSATGDSFSIPSSVTEIGGYAFTYNNTLETLTIHPDVTIISSSMIRSCEKLATINSLSTIPNVVKWDLGSTGKHATTRVINVPAGCLGAYQTAWSNFLTCSYPFTFMCPSSTQGEVVLGGLIQD